MAPGQSYGIGYFMYDQVIIGIDQSYKNTGITIVADGKIKIVRSIQLSKLKSNSDKRRVLKQRLFTLLSQISSKCSNIVCIIERIRLRSQGFININYIKSIGALNAMIVDVMSEFDVKVYSVDTRCWKAQVIGTSKPLDNKYGVPPEKYPTVVWCIKQGFKSSILIDMSNTRTRKGTFIKDGKRYKFNDDAADSCAIAMFGVIGDKSKLELEQ